MTLTQRVFSWEDGEMRQHRYSLSDSVWKLQMFQLKSLRHSPHLAPHSNLILFHYRETHSWYMKHSPRWGTGGKEQLAQHWGNISICIETSYKTQPHPMTIRATHTIATDSNTYNIKKLLGILHYINIYIAQYYL